MRRLHVRRRRVDRPTPRHAAARQVPSRRPGRAGAGGDVDASGRSAAPRRSAPPGRGRGSRRRAPRRGARRRRSACSWRTRPTGPGPAATAAPRSWPAAGRARPRRAAGAPRPAAPPGRLGPGHVRGGRRRRRPRRRCRGPAGGLLGLGVAASPRPWPLDDREALSRWCSGVSSGGGGGGGATLTQRSRARAHRPGRRRRRLVPPRPRRRLRARLGLRRLGLGLARARAARDAVRNAGAAGTVGARPAAAAGAAASATGAGAARPVAQRAAPGVVRFLHGARLRPGLAVRRRRERVRRVGPGAVGRQGPLVTHVGGEPLGRQPRGYCHFLGALRTRGGRNGGLLVGAEFGAARLVTTQRTPEPRAACVRVVSFPRRCDGVRSAADVAHTTLCAERTSVLPR